MSNPILISAQGVSKRFVLHKDKSFKERIVNFGRARKHRDDFWALKDINLEIEFGRTVGLVGHNGSGKSTLLKVIGGIIEPTTGVVTRRGRMAALLELGAGFHQDLTGRENVYLNAAILGLSKKETDRQFDAIVEFSGIESFIDTQVKFYSSGMYVRLAFAVAVHVDPDLLLVDEVLAVGDEPFQQKCMDKIAEFQREGRTIVLVSHSSDQVGRLCDRVVVLDHGDLIHDGAPEESLRVLRLGYEEARLEREKEHRQELETFAKIVAITPRANEVASDGAFKLGSDVTFEFEYDLTASQSPLTAGIAIETAAGQPVYGLDTGMLETAIPTDPGRHRVDFTLRNQSLGAGQFVVRGSLERKSGEPLDRMNPGARFEVEHMRIGHGLMHLDAEAVVSS